MFWLILNDLWDDLQNDYLYDTQITIHAQVHVFLKLETKEKEIREKTKTVLANPSCQVFVIDSATMLSSFDKIYVVLKS